MVMLLKENRTPTTSERFGQAFSNLGQAAATEIPQMLMQRKQQQAISNQFGQDIGNLPADLRDKVIVEQLKGGSKLQNQMFTDQLKRQGDQQQKEQEQAKDQQEYAGLIDEVERLKSSAGPLGWRPTNNKERSELNAVGSILAEKAYNILLKNKGAMTDRKMKNLMSPYHIKAGDLQSTIDGKIAALKLLTKYSQQGIPADQALEMVKQQVPGVNQLSAEEAKSILDEAGGDKQAARKLAKSRGFEF